MENNFEKKVHDKLEELKIEPSGSVWDRISKQISHRKSDRRKLLFLLPIVILLLTAGYLLYSPQSRDTVADTQTVEKTQVKKSEQKIDANASKASGPENQMNATSETPGQDAQSSHHAPKLSGSGNEMTEHENSIAERNRKAEKSLAGHKVSERILVKETAQIGDTEVIREPGETELAVNGQKNTLRSESRDQISTEQVQQNFPKVLTTVPLEHELAFYHIDTLPSHINHIITEDIFESIWGDMKGTADSMNRVAANLAQSAKSFNNKKWQFGITGLAGLSHIGSNFLGLNQVSNRYAYADLSSSPFSNAGYPPYSQRVAYASQFKNGFSFSIGGYVERILTNATSISTGINYRQYVVTSMVGRKNDSLQTFSAYNPTTRFSNRFHFIEIPLMFNWKLGKKIPLTANAGLTALKLIGSNALQLNTNAQPTDPDAKALYNDNDLLNKTQFSGYVGLSWKIAKKYQVGPAVQFHFTTLSQEGLYAGTHFLFFGMSARYALSK